MSQVNNAEMIGAIWETVKYYIHDRSDRVDAATSLIETLHDLGLDPETIENIAEDDALLRKSLKDYLQMHEDNEPESDDFDYADDDYDVDDDQ